MFSKEKKQLKYEHVEVSRGNRGQDAMKNYHLEMKKQGQYNPNEYQDNQRTVCEAIFYYLTICKCIPIRAYINSCKECPKITFCLTLWTIIAVTFVALYILKIFPWLD